MYDYYYIIALSQILSTLQIISHLEHHNPQSEFVTTSTIYTYMILRYYIYIYIYIYRTSNPPHIKQLDKFENEMIGMVKEIQFRKMRNNIQQNMYEDMRRFKESESIFVKSDKSGNLYEIEKGRYKQMMFKEVVKNYKKAPPDLEKELNNDAKMLAHRLGIVDRVEKYNTKNCFITIKDHKSDFKTNPECRLINPAKTQLSRVSKIIVQEICDSLRLALNINQWRSTKDCIKWFEEYEKNDRCSFIKYDIKDFYPSITKRTLDRALDLAKEYMVIPLDKVEIIKHCRKTLLYYEDSVWIKKGEGGNFDVSIGAYDGAEICELVGCVLLYSINKIMDPSSHGLYLDDGLIIMDKSTPKKCDGIRKRLYKLFNEFGFRLDIRTDLKITAYPDVTLNLYSGTVSPFRKRNQDLRYVNRGSNHPTQVSKHVPKDIEHRLSNNSSNKEIFEQSKQEYEEALKNDGYRINLEYRDREEGDTQKRRNRPRKFLWFNPPYKIEVVNNLGKEFFKLLKRNFPSGSPLHKIFNKNCVKLSYICMPNINGIINKSSIAKLRRKIR